MKFNKYFLDQIVDDWKYFYTNYSSLKQAIKQNESHTFMSLMKNELEKVNQFVKIILHYDPENRYLESYILMNYMAFFKAIKKHDKQLCKTYKIGFFNLMKSQSFYTAYINRKRECQQIRLVIFDKDGTLINHDKIFIPWLKTLINAIKPILPKDHNILKHLGFNEHDNTFGIDSIIPRGTNDDIRNSITEFIVKNTDNTVSTVRNFIKMHWVDIDFTKDDIETHGDLIDIFTKLNNMNIKIAICTSDDRDPTNKMIDITGIRDKIDYYVCGNDPISSKPSPEPIWKICRKLDITPSETIMVGDTMSDIHAGINARCGKIISVLTGGYLRSELNNADIITKDITFIPDIVKKINVSTLSNRWKDPIDNTNLHQIR